MLHDLWKSFESTGNVQAYLKYKQNEHVEIDNVQQASQNVERTGDTDI